MPYILMGENLQIFGDFSDFDNFKPYSFGIAQYIANLKQRPETTYITKYLCKI